MARAIVGDTYSTQARFLIDQFRQTAVLMDARATALDVFGEFVELLQREISAGRAASNALGNLSRARMPQASAPRVRVCEDRYLRPARAATSTGTNDKTRVLEFYQFYSATSSPKCRDQQLSTGEPKIIGVIAPAPPKQVDTIHQLGAAFNPPGAKWVGSGTLNGQ